MLQKIKAFLFGSGGGRPKLSYVEQQIDTGKAILEMIERAQVLGIDIQVWIEVGDAREGMTLPGGGVAANDIYHTVSNALRFWLERYSDEQGDAAAKRIWESIERKLDQDKVGKEDKRWLESRWYKDPPKR